jgi:hypothetical protein
MDTNLCNTVPAHPEDKDNSTLGMRQKLSKSDAADAQVVVPKAVDIPLPKPVDQQISVPASINGRDLSDGKP